MLCWLAKWLCHARSCDAYFLICYCHILTLSYLCTKTFDFEKNGTKSERFAQQRCRSQIQLRTKSTQTTTQRNYDAWAQHLTPFWISCINHALTGCGFCLRGLTPTLFCRFYLWTAVIRTDPHKSADDADPQIHICKQNLHPIRLGLKNTKCLLLLLLSC